MARSPRWLGWRHSLQQMLLGQHKKFFHTLVGSSSEASGRGSINSKVLRELCQEGRIDEAFRALDLMRQRGISVTNILCCVLKRCPKNHELAICRHVHDLAIRAGLESDTAIAACIIQMYASLGCLQEAREVFHIIPEPNEFVWASIISAHCDLKQPQEAIQLYHQLQKSSATPNGYIFVAVLKACAKAGDLTSGKLVHSDVIGSQFESDLYVGSALVNMYTKCGSLEDAQRVFDNLHTKNIVTWSALIAGYAQKGLGQGALDLYERMRQDGVASDSFVFASILQACGRIGDVQKGREVHTHILERALEGQPHITSALLDMYLKCKSLQDACLVFDRLAGRHVVAWNVMILGYAQHGLGQEALSLYKKMERSGILANVATYIGVLQACCNSGALKQGKEVHAQIVERGLEGDLHLASSLVDMYVKCGSLEDAKKVFDRLPVKDVCIWQAMLAGYVQHGMGEESLVLYDRMQQAAVVADRLVLCSIIQACGQIGALKRGKEIHAEIMNRGLERDPHIVGALVEMYVNCRTLQDARIVLDRVATRNNVTWNVLILGYARQGLGHESLHLFKRMKENGIPADAYTFVSILQACGSVGALQEGKNIHEDVLERGLGEDLLVGNGLVSMYAKCGSLEDAAKVFISLPSKDLVTWTAMILGYAQQGHGQEALNLYERMQSGGMLADSVTFSVILKTCGSIGSLEQGKKIHKEIQERGLEGVPYIESSLVDMYAKCGSLEDARTVFGRSQSRNVVTWNAMIWGYVEHGLGQEALDLYDCMQEEGLLVDSVTILSILRLCGSTKNFERGKQLHEYISEKGLEIDSHLGSSLLDMYAKCGSLEDARAVFDLLPVKDVVIWAAIINAYAQHGFGKEALGLYEKMELDGISADSHMFVSLLQACGRMKALGEGKAIHKQILERGLEEKPYVGTSLVEMYAACGSLQDARRVFDRLTLKDVNAWKAIIGLYAMKEFGQEALDLYDSMQQHGIPADSFTFVSLLQACGSIGDIEKGKEIHAKIREIGVQGELHIGISLVDMYTRCQSPLDARRVFRTLLTQDVLVSSEKVGGFSQLHGDDKKMNLCDGLGINGVSADPSILVSMLQTCTSTGAIEMGKRLHADIRELGLESDSQLSSTLVDMYVQCGRVEDAQGVFDRVPTRNVSTWNALIGGYAEQGLHQQALDLSEKMQEAGIPADEFTFASILRACRQQRVDHGQIDSRSQRTLDNAQNCKLPLS